MSPPRPTPITARDRLGLTLFLAVVVHAMVALGITFDTERAPPYVPPTLDVTLVQNRSAAPPEDPDYLAQAASDGGGNVSERVRPTTPAPPPEPLPVPEPLPAPPAAAVIAPAAPEREVLAAPQAEQKAAAPEPPSAAPAPAEPRPTAAELVAASHEIARLTAEIDQSLQAYAQRPREKFINARTREHTYAAYMAAWVAKVERVGNVNFPDEARRRGIFGDLTLEVVLAADGSVREITLLGSSGHKVLDDAAVRIVELAAPFAPFPDDIAKEADLLRITRTWQFRDGRFNR
jgi:periplasmic protein TonB